MVLGSIAMGHYSGPRREHWADWSLGLLSAPFPMALLSAKGGTNFIPNSMDMSFCELRELVMDREA